MDPAAAQSACELFGLGAPLATAESVAGGLTNRLWRIETERGVFALKEMNRDYQRDDYVSWHERAFTLEVAARRAGVPAPRPAPESRTGRCLAEIPGTGPHPMTVRVHESGGRPEARQRHGVSS